MQRRQCPAGFFEPCPVYLCSYVFWSFLLGVRRPLFGSTHATVYMCEVGCISVTLRPE